MDSFYRDYKWHERHGDMACPFNSLYWDFFARHRKRLGKNARVGMMYRVWDRMDSGGKKQVLNQAAGYHKDLNRL
jgi:deoxyribodipyrimidine photolyase-related protein